MRTIIITIILFLFATTLFAQMGVIVDSDGFTNVRAEPNIDSEIIYKVSEGEVFWYMYEYVELSLKDEWVKIEIQKDKYSTHGQGYNYSDSIVGYVHSSRFSPLYDLSPPPKEYDFDISLSVGGFISEGREVDSISPFHFLIDGKWIWGADGGQPKTQLNEFQVRLEGKETEVDRKYYSDLFNVFEGYSIYKHKEYYFVYNQYSDGAGAYEVAWVFTVKDGLIQRLVGSQI